MYNNTTFFGDFAVVLAPPAGKGGLSVEEEGPSPVSG